MKATLFKTASGLVDFTNRFKQLLSALDFLELLLNHSNLRQHLSKNSNLTTLHFPTLIYSLSLTLSIVHLHSVEAYIRQAASYS